MTFQNLAEELHPFIRCYSFLWMPAASATASSRDLFLVTVPDSWLKGCEFESQQEWQENFRLKSQLCVLTLIWCPFHPCATDKSAGGRSHLNTHTPLAQQSRSGLTMPLSRLSVGNYSEMSSHANCQKTFSHSYLSLLSHCGLILA